MTHSPVEQAALNNALWCDAVCRAHGAAGTFYDAVWLYWQPAPRFYPNAVTLVPEATAVQYAYIESLMSGNLNDRCSVKDSFCKLDLATLGLSLLFEATWLWREPSQPLTAPMPAQCRWARVRNAAELAAWEQAWSGSSADASSVLPRIFLPVLLANPSIAFIAAYQDESLVAGAIAHRTGDIVGLSNVFTLAADAPAFWTGCITMAQAFFLGLPLVGYEHGPELAVAVAAGFEPLEPLRVWTK